MTLRNVSPNFGMEESIAREVERLRPMIARQKAGLLGPAPGARNVVGNEEVDMWDYRDPSVDVIEVAAQLMAEGKDMATAQAGATLQAFPNRGPMMISAAANNAKEQARYAEQMQRRSMKRQEEQGDGDVPRSEY